MDGGEITSDAGLFMKDEIDRRFELTESLARMLVERREGKRVDHSAGSMLRQRLLAK